jgi:hypothetical protein
MVPGMAQEMLRDLAPLLAEEGIDVDNIDVPDLETLQRAMSRAVERRNMQLFTPVGPVRDIAAATLRLVAQAVLDGDAVLAGALLDQVQPESPDNSSPRSPAASASPSACSTTGCPASTGPPRRVWPNTLAYLPGTGPVNAPPPTSLSWPARARPSAPWTSCSSARAAIKSSPARLSLWSPPSAPGAGSPTHQRPS